METHNIRIRRVKKPDLARIIEIERESFPDPWDEPAFLETLQYFPSTFFVAVNDAQVVGFIAAGIEDTGEERYGHIMNIAVRNAYRHKGIGRKLVQRAEYECILEGASGIQLEVRASNTGAQQFYTSMGYQQVFTFAAYYSNAEDAIVMMKWFGF